MKAPARRPAGSLDRMVVHCVDRATDIQVTEDVAVSIGLRASPLKDRLEMAQLYLDMSRLVDLVRMVEPEFRALVKKRLGEVALHHAQAAAKQTGEDDAGEQQPQQG